MQIHAILTAATDPAARDNLPLLLALAGVAISLIALFRVSTIRQEFKQSPLAANPKPGQSPTTAPKSGAPAITPASGGIPPEIVAVIAAAVASVTGNRTLRIVSIKPMSTSWERAGRQSVLTSHRIR